MATQKRVWLFEEGDASMRDLLGGKGANLSEMSNIGLPVPPGFTITTEVCNDYYANGGTMPEGLMEEIRTALTHVEQKLGKKLGDPANPLLLSVRSGAKFSMPGMMDTVLNLGMNDRSLEGLANQSGNRRFAYDAYRRFIQMFGKIVMGVPGEEFEKALEGAKEKARVTEAVYGRRGRASKDGLGGAQGPAGGGAVRTPASRSRPSAQACSAAVRAGTHGRS